MTIFNTDRWRSHRFVHKRTFFIYQPAITYGDIGQQRSRNEPHGTDQDPGVLLWVLAIIAGTYLARVKKRAFCQKIAILSFES